MGRSGDEQHTVESLWGLDTCDRCGVVIVLGERSVVTNNGGRRSRICATCAALPASSGADERHADDLPRAA